jgi:hypothetical protein
LTALYGQVGDSTVCYNKKELQKIATKLVKLKECDSLFKIQELEIFNRDSIIIKQSNRIVFKDSIISKKDLIIEVKDNNISYLESSLEDEKKRHKFTKLSLVGTIVLFITYIFFGN